MRGELVALHRRLASTMIYVTHDQVEAMTMADQIVVLREGVVEQVGSPIELYARPRNRFVAGFLGAPQMNFIQGRVDGSMALGLALDGGVTVALPGRDLSTLPDGAPVTVGIRPEHAEIGSGPLEITRRERPRFSARRPSSCTAPRSGAGFTLARRGISAPPLATGADFVLPAPFVHLFDASGRAVAPRPTGAPPTSPDAGVDELDQRVDRLGVTVPAPVLRLRPGILYFAVITHWRTGIKPCR